MILPSSPDQREIVSTMLWDEEADIDDDASTVEIERDGVQRACGEGRDQLRNETARSTSGLRHGMTVSIRSPPAAVALSERAAAGLVEALCAHACAPDLGSSHLLCRRWPIVAGELRQAIGVS
jgi:hypothetical protein